MLILFSESLIEYGYVAKPIYKFGLNAHFLCRVEPTEQKFYVMICHEMKIRQVKKLLFQSESGLNVIPPLFLLADCFQGLTFFELNTIKNTTTMGIQYGRRSKCQQQPKEELYRVSF